MSPRGLAILFILTANILGGISYYWQKLAVEGIPPATVALFRNLIAVAAMGVFVYRSRAKDKATARDRGPDAPPVPPRPRSDLLRIVTIGVFGFGLPLVLGNIGVKLSTATNGSILILLEPVAILIFSWWLLREPVLLGQVAGIACGLFGAYLVTVGDRPPSQVMELLTESSYLQGNMILLLHGVLWGLYSPLMKPMAHRYRAVDLTFAIQVFGLIPMLPLAILEWSTWAPEAETFWPAMGYTIVLAILVSTLATILWNASLKNLKASTVAPFVFVQPLVGTAAGTILLDETLTIAAWIGSGLVVAAVLLVTYARPRRTGLPAPSEDRPGVDAPSRDTPGEDAT